MRICILQGSPVKIYLFIFSVVIFQIANGQNDPAGARPAGMANAALNFTDIWSVFHNQAGLAKLESFSAGAFYENKFFVNELSYSGIGISNPLGSGTIALSFTNFGYSVYGESKLGLAYAMNLSENFSFGVQANYHRTSIGSDNYGSSDAFTAELGFRLEVSQKVSLAAHIFNPTRTELNDYQDERIPTILRFGGEYTISDEVLISGEFEKDIDQSALVRGGIEYHPAEILYLRIGAASQPSLFSFGVGLDFGVFQFDLASTYHSLLGYSPQVSLSYSPKE